MELNIRFEQEVTLKKEVYEIDLKSEDLAFQLFSKQLNHTKAKNKGQDIKLYDNEMKGIRDQIEQNAKQKIYLTEKI